jgi:hypothetical protein
MQFTSKFILLAIALAYGRTAVSALPIGESSESVAVRSAEYEDINAREIDDMELFVRDPFSLFGFGTPARDRVTPPSTPPSHETKDPHTDAGLSKTKSEKTSGSPVASSLHEAKPVKSKKVEKGRGPRYDPKPTMDVASRRQFRKSAKQNSALLNEAAKDKNHAFHSTAIHIKQEAALRKNPKLLKQALKNSNHALHGTAQTVKAQNSRRKATLRTALKDEKHPLHEAAVAHRNGQHDKTIRNANPKLVETALADKSHKLHEAAQRVAAQDKAAAFSALPFGS